MLRFVVLALVLITISYSAVLLVKNTNTDNLIVEVDEELHCFGFSYNDLDSWKVYSQGDEYTYVIDDGFIRCVHE